MLQAPVLWGLERRIFPRVMRWRIPRRLMERAITLRSFRDRFARKQFLRPIDPATRSAFFDGYLRCAAFADFFEWFTPGFLRDLERRFVARPGALEGISIWWGGRDRVVDLGELRLTEGALGVHWPLAEFPDWGHYPMIDVPEEWAAALCDALARQLPEVGAERAVRRPEDPEAP